MSASHDPPSEVQEIHPHPPMPAVHDEAADSPAWLPVTGLAMVLLMVLFVMLRSAMAPPAPAAGTDGEVDAAPAAEAPPAPAAE